MIGVLVCICVVSVSTAIIVTAVFLWHGYMHNSSSLVARGPCVEEMQLQQLILRHLGASREHGQRLAANSVTLWNAAAEVQCSLPTELLAAIVEIRDTARALADTLAAIERLQPSSDAPVRRGVVAAKRSDSPVLTRQELVTLTPEASPATKTEFSPTQRFSFPCTQHAAPWSPDQPLPAPDEFRRVKCRDVSAGGISFLWPDRPDFEHIVVMIGALDAPIYMAAQIVHSKAVFMFDEVGYLIGCKFLKRLDTTAESRTAANSIAARS